MQHADSRPQRQPSQTLTQRNGRHGSQRRVEDDVDEEEVVVAQNYEDGAEPGPDNTSIIRVEPKETCDQSGAARTLPVAKAHGASPGRNLEKRYAARQRGAFKAVFEEAQSILRSTFYMELVELLTRTRAATHDIAGGCTGKEKAGTQNGEEGGDRQAVTGLKKKGAVPTVSQGSKTCIIRSTLDPMLIERAALTNKCTLEAGAADAPDDVNDTEPGVLDLPALLRRLRLHPQAQLALPTHTPHCTLTFDAYLLQLRRQGYLDRMRIGGAGNTSQKRGRGRGRGGTQQGGGAGGGHLSGVTV
ncbi:hypothetical protein BJV78DRAFT_1153766 [Lactifluus subvellereus]|nr:hypothetical protein BJV78DRAFT_1153766 [Lactifluus subvellereus]